MEPKQEENRKKNWTIKTWTIENQNKKPNPKVE